MSGADLLRGRVLVTGATGGLGQAIARAFAARGATLLLTGRRAEVLEPLAAELGGQALPCDMADRDALQQLIEQAGEVDVLIANAGLPAAGPLDDFTVDEVDRALDVNLRAPIVLTHALTPGMVERGRGHVLLMSSLAGRFATGLQPLYVSTKYGLRGFALSIREDLGPTGVGVSTIFPGFIRDAGMFADTGVELPRYVGTSSPEDVAAAVLRAVEQDKMEITVAPVPARALALFSGAFPGAGRRLRALAPDDEKLARKIVTSPSHRGKR